MQTPKPQRKRMRRDFQSPMQNKRSPAVPGEAALKSRIRLYTQYYALRDSSKLLLLTDLIVKWKRASRDALVHLGQLLGPVVVSNTVRHLTLLELAESVKIDIACLGDYRKDDDEFVDTL
ncbi:hypothetical protein HDV02_000207 [Globomyces sp. JEL0801]|nr:hypothetical protein HDV02_000207 [Globomyces sp. JEL0801]